MQNIELSEATIKLYEALIRQAVGKIKHTAYGKFLLERFPLHLTSETCYARENSVLLKTGSPACTDGIDVFVSARTTAAFFLGMEFHEWEEPYIWGEEERWKARMKEDKHIMQKPEIINEIMDIILHEYTHAINQHPKLQRAAASKSKNYQQRLAVACEIQANDGLMGHNYAYNYSQQPMGVTNKRQHLEVLGEHTLAGILRKLEMPQEMQAGSSASQSSKAMQQMMEATGAKQKWDRELQEESKNMGKGNESDDGEQQGEHGDQEDNGDEQRGGRMAWLDKVMNKEADENIVEQLSAKALSGIRNLLLASISKELSYDPNTDSVVYNQVKKRISTRTYSRPSKRQSTISGGVELIKKGVRHKRVVEYDQSNDLLVLAVDASGSMSHQEKYVANIMGDLIKQVDELAKQHNLEIKWENLLATLHTDHARPLVSVKSDKWAETMRNYRANGGNDFDSVLRQIQDQLLIKEQREYDSITVLNLSDGLDVLDSSWLNTPMGDYVDQGKVRWVDALIGDTRDIREAIAASERDLCKIREQVILACDYK